MFQRHPVQNDCSMFITTNIQDRRPIFQNPAHAREAIETLYRVQKLHPFLLFGFVMMPDHCHLLIQVPASEKISTVMMQFKSGVAFNLGLGPIWQSRFHIKYPKDSREVLTYIHQNPVRAKLCDEPWDYLWSSAHPQWVVDDLGWR